MTLRAKALRFSGLLCRILAVPSLPRILCCLWNRRPGRFICINESSPWLTERVRKFSVHNIAILLDDKRSI